MSDRYDSYLTLSREAGDEFIVSRSRFIGRARPAADEEEALDFIAGLRKEHWDATHHVWAYVLDAGRERASDDGEPQGTAGVPVLEVIRKAGLRQAAVVVTRYFGGVKLGAGGLVRAYTQGAKIALAAAHIVRRQPYLAYRISADYALAGRLQREYGNKGYFLQDTVYAAEVSFTVLVLPEEAEALGRLTAELSAGRVLPAPNPGVVYREAQASTD